MHDREATHTRVHAHPAAKPYGLSADIKQRLLLHLQRNSLRAADVATQRKLKLP